jgi:hypothetical protein
MEMLFRTIDVVNWAEIWARCMGMELQIEMRNELMESDLVLLLIVHHNVVAHEDVTEDHEWEGGRGDGR